MSCLPENLVRHPPSRVMQAHRDDPHLEPGCDKYIPSPILDAAPSSDARPFFLGLPRLRMRHLVIILISLPVGNPSDRHSSNPAEKRGVVSGRVAVSISDRRIAPSTSPKSIQKFPLLAMIQFCKTRRVRSIGLSCQMAAGEVVRHSSAGAGILQHRPHTIPANETIVFLHIEILTRFTL